MDCQRVRGASNCFFLGIIVGSRSRTLSNAARMTLWFVRGYHSLQHHRDIYHSHLPAIKAAKLAPYTCPTTAGGFVESAHEIFGTTSESLRPRPQAQTTGHPHAHAHTQGVEVEEGAQNADQRVNAHHCHHQHPNEHKSPP
ncbi:hypothetical protein EGR_03326 [Echinococcus granulosus]|uniref:Uncharacterized protein n=1 Tax=Echinococcus granulosus TaxID=6210 RepID=W6UJR4_ECHGR|nr:hypothetical protein EGR_03326 [Echinococcus granulosus]EUB61780.1 hypothetical protein EGR_03326 [Echinococcus granulosus]